MSSIYKQNDFDLGKKKSKKKIKIKHEVFHLLFFYFCIFEV